MAQCRRLKTAPDARRDLISALPVEVKDRILECLPTLDAARAALLSKSWNDVWLQHGRLAFDWDFLLTVPKCRDNYGRTLVNIINNILFSRAWPVKKFTLQISYDDPQPPQSDIDRWCLFLSRNGAEELNIRLDNSDDWGPDYQLPFYLLSCRTIKELIVRGPSIDLPVNACGIFSNVTSLAFYHVEFKCSVSSSVWLSGYTEDGFNTKSSMEAVQGVSSSAWETFNSGKIREATYASRIQGIEALNSKTWKIPAVDGVGPPSGRERAGMAVANTGDLRRVFLTCGGFDGTHPPWLRLAHRGCDDALKSKSEPHNCSSYADDCMHFAGDGEGFGGDDGRLKHSPDLF
nr:F-box/FBD/LRR-repeat protein At1g13570-like [Ipomoea batatas]